jgi:hypothetical protein
VEQVHPSGISTIQSAGHEIESTHQFRRDLGTVSAIPESWNIMPVLPDCWETEMSERLDRVVVHEDGSGNQSCTSTITDIELCYRGPGAARSLRRLKPGEELNDELINALLRSDLASHRAIEETAILNLKPRKGCEKRLTVVYFLCDDGQTWCLQSAILATSFGGST